MTHLVRVDIGNDRFIMRFKNGENICIPESLQQFIINEYLIRKSYLCLVRFKANALLQLGLWISS